MNGKRIGRWMILVLLLGSASALRAQHVFGVRAGYGSGTARFYPKMETRSVWGMYSMGVSWRYYSTQRFVGAVGVDIEMLERGFSFSPNSQQIDKRYIRYLDAIMIPIVWQPHVYVAHHRLRFYLDLAVTFSYNFNSQYDNELMRQSGRYPFKNVRDNRLGYGLAGGPGFAVLVGRWELGFSARYYFGYADVLRNRNRYADNATDDPAVNPFTRTPLRSPLDNLSFSVTLSYRVGKGTFRSFDAPRKRRNRASKEFQNHFGHSGHDTPARATNR